MQFSGERSAREQLDDEEFSLADNEEMLYSLSELTPVYENERSYLESLPVAAHANRSYLDSESGERTEGTTELLVAYLRYRVVVLATGGLGQYSMNNPVLSGGCPNFPLVGQPG